MIFVAAYGLWDHLVLREMWKVRKMDFVVFVVSYLSTLFLGSSIGLLIALGFSLVAVV
jgi:MFS superfamily sulfate permease-like transporter